ncbi:hypothetical protein QAD02_021310 [Eretmocerus hayati]|uniref:Uncharacterized protein n=1 Tax=Eretmocerus hayati TaxID=131215 RepID=A0ACC2PQ38_9HYME|nr:hypothetical protein QAD02_021310 [Eretmocerus hayati]
MAMGPNYIFVDLQGFLIGVGTCTFIPKEIALINMEMKDVNEEYEMLHYLVRPPFSAKNLDKVGRESVCLSVDYGHNISWENGSIPFENKMDPLEQELENVSSIFRINIVYMNTHKKKLYLESILPKIFKEDRNFWVKNIYDDYNSSNTLEYLYGDYPYTFCKFHNNLKFRCARHNTEYMYGLVKNEMRK